MKTDRDKFLTAEETEQLLQCVRKRGSRRDFVLCLLGLNLGLRVGELVRLRVADLDRQERLVHVPTLKRLTDQEKTAKRKAQESGATWSKPRLKRGDLPTLYLDIPLLDEVFADIGKYIKEAGIKGWIFPSPKDDGHLSTRQAERIFKHWARETGLRPQVSIHVFRHTRGTDLYEKGIDTLGIAWFLRHESEATTLRYKHLSPKKKAEMTQKAGGIGVPDVAF